MLSLLDGIRDAFIDMAPGMPPACWGVTALVLILLATAAIVDIFTALVPDILIIVGLLLVTGMQGFFASWDIAAYHLGQAVAAGFLIWAANAAWYRLFRRDALGMGDAKWTMLAVDCFGVMPALFAWGLGSILATLFIAAAWLARRKTARVTFIPFLFIGLGLGLYWIRFQPMGPFLSIPSR
jgi:prepilin signal peptidase PulO-like enzyme (type II secretory pathway)